MKIFKGVYYINIMYPVWANSFYNRKTCAIMLPCKDAGIIRVSKTADTNESLCKLKWIIVPTKQNENQIN
jgi:hypothetical protein